MDNKLIPAGPTRSALNSPKKSGPQPGDTFTIGGVDMINHPPHYQGDGEIECIDAIKSALGHEQYVGFLRGQVLRYTWRLGQKDTSLENAQKAGWYANKLEEELTP